MKICKPHRTATAPTTVAEDVMSHTLEGLLREVQPLFTAVYLSPPEVAAHIFESYPDSAELKGIVNDAALYHQDSDRRKRIGSKGFFEFELRYLLQFGLDVPNAGARLVPIFFSALKHAVELGLTEDLQNDLRKFLELRRVRDGFVIIGATNRSLASLH